jgi:hypothetical protein
LDKTFIANPLTEEKSLPNYPEVLLGRADPLIGESFSLKHGSAVRRREWLINPSGFGY